MSMYQIYFSPTGGTKKVVDIIGSVWEGEKTEIDLSDPKQDFSNYTFQEPDICLIAVPSFGGRVPEAALQRLGRMRGKNSRAVLIGVYGNREYEDTLLELKDTLKTAGFCCVSAIAAVAEHSIMHQFGAGRPDAQDKKELQEFANTIKLTLGGKQEIKEVEVPGHVPFREYHGVPFKPKAGRNCKECGLCAKSCPVQAIPREHPAKTDQERCISCMRCVQTCPKNARKLNRMVLSAASRKMKKACGGRKENKLFMG